MARGVQSDVNGVGSGAVVVHGRWSKKIWAVAMKMKSEFSALCI